MKHKKKIEKAVKKEVEKSLLGGILPLIKNGFKVTDSLTLNILEYDFDDKGHSLKFSLDTVESFESN